MKKKYISPESEYINFDLEDVVTATMPGGDPSKGLLVNDGETGGNTPETSSGTGDSDVEGW